MSIPQTFIQELLARADVVEIVGRFVPLKKNGANFTGLCPFHAEKSPSFSVSPAKQFFHCFGCGKSGNAVGFLMDHAGMSFVDAVHDLAQQYGLQVPDDDRSPQDRAAAAAARAQQVTLGSVLEKAGAAYVQHLRTSEKAIAYFKGRGLSGEIARTFGLGYAPEGWRTLASVFADYSDPLLVQSGLVIAGEPGDEAATGEAKRYDRFRDRVMFPIRNVKGEYIGFGGRVLGDEKPKYLNSPETPVFSKGRELYGLFEARSALREHGYALVTEGYMDVVALAQLGFANAVATLGTACTAEHVQQLFRFTETIVFSFDGDAAGRRAARKALDAALPFATDVRTVKFLFLPAEHDPDSFIREQGAQAFAACVVSALPLSKFMLQAAAADCDLDTAEGRAHMASNARPLWTRLPEGLLKPQLLDELAEQIQVDRRDLWQLWQPAQPARGRATGAAGTRSKSYQKASKQTPASSGQPHVLLNNRDARAVDPAAGPASADFARSVNDAVAASLDGNEPPPSAWEHLPNPPADAAWSPSMPRRQPLRSQLSGRPARRTQGRALPASREDRVLRLLLTDPHSWDRLSSEEHELLTALPPPHGPLFTWLESQQHEHGPQPWGALREGLRGHAHEHHAALQIEQIPAGIETDWNEVRSILQLLLRLRLTAEMNELAARASADADVLGRYRELEARLRALAIK